MPHLIPSAFLRNKDLISPVSVVVVVKENGDVVHNHYLHKREIRSEILTWYIFVTGNESLLSYCPYGSGHVVRMVYTKLAYRILRETCWICSYPKTWGLSYDQFLKPFCVITSHNTTRVYYYRVFKCRENKICSMWLLLQTFNVINIRPHFFDVATKILQCLLCCQFC